MISARAIRSKLELCLAECREQCDELPDGVLDIRVCVREDGTWFVATGDVQYDSEHTWICVDSCVWPSMTTLELIEFADDLYERVICAEVE